MQKRSRHSNLELRGPKSGLTIGPQSSRGVPSAPLFAQIPNLTTTRGTEGVRSCDSAESKAPIRNPP
eukprot:412485-Alexandrium_andersonii.AAC.1